MSIASGERPVREIFSGPQSLASGLERKICEVGRSGGFAPEVSSHSLVVFAYGKAYNFSSLLAGFRAWYDGNRYALFPGIQNNGKKKILWIGLASGQATVPAGGIAMILGIV